MSASAVALAAESPRLPAAQIAAKSAPAAPEPGASAAATKSSPAREGSDKAHSGVDTAARPRPDSAHRFELPHGRVCFTAAETREKIVSHHLTEPFRALRAGRLQGEALRARLCRWKPDQFVYEISVLRRDGRIVHVYMNAANGQTVGALDESDHIPSDPK